MAAEKKSPSELWLSRIDERLDTIRKDWLDDADKILEVYNDGKRNFNILFSNTETLLPALYNSTPRPDVSRRYTARNPQERQLDWAVAQVGERTLEYLLDSNDEGYESFDDAIKRALFDALVPGMGQYRVRLKQDEGYQTICFEQVPYDRLIWGYARKWEQVPWVAFGHDMTKEAFEKFYPRAAKSDEFREINWDVKPNEEADPEKSGRLYGPTTLVWEVWDHASQEILHVSALLKGQILLKESYPCRLSSRFPCPRPLIFGQIGKGWTPLPLYKKYEKLAEDLEDVTRRLGRVIRAIRVRGVYNSQIAEFERVLGEENENALIPSENANALFTDGKGLDQNVWLMPIDMLVKTAQQLYIAQGNIKQSIFELMGIADIQRGASAAQETASAQQIKDKWGTVRLKKNQSQVANFAREGLRIAMEMAAECFTPATFMSVTRLQLPLQPMPPTPGQPPPPPSWPQVLQVMRDQLQRTYRVDVETNSTVDLEATEDKESIAEFMNAFGQMMAGFKPLLEGQAMSPELAKEVLLEVTKRYRFGRRVEHALEAMQPPQPQQDGSAKMDKMAAEHEQEMVKVTKRIAELELQLKEAQIGGKLRENELTADFGAKIRSKDLQMADKAIDQRFQQAAGELKRLKDEVAGMVKGSERTLQSAKFADPALTEAVTQQTQLLQSIQQTQQMTVQALQQMMTQWQQFMEPPKVLEVFEDESGQIVDVRDLTENGGKQSEGLR